MVIILNIKKLQNNRIIFIYIILVLSFVLILFKVIDIEILNRDYYINSLDELTIKTIEIVFF